MLLPDPHIDPEEKARLTMLEKGYSTKVILGGNLFGGLAAPGYTPSHINIHPILCSLSPNPLPQPPFSSLVCPLSTILSSVHLEYARPFELKLVGDREQLPRGFLTAGTRQVTPLCRHRIYVPSLIHFSLVHFVCLFVCLLIHWGGGGGIHYFCRDVSIRTRGSLKVFI